MKALRNKFSEQFFSKGLVIWIIILTCLYSLLAIIRHNNFQSGGFDLGLYDQSIWQYSRFISPYNTIKERFILGDHLSLTIPLLAPLYWIWDDVRFILIFQAFWMMLSVYGVWKTALLRKLTPFTAFAISFSYSLFYGIQYLIYFDFHSVAIGVGLIPWIMYFIEKNNKKFIVLTVIFLLLSQENMGIALVCIASLYIFRKSYFRLSIVLILIGVIYSLIAAKIIGFFSPVGFQYWPSITMNPISLFTQFFDSTEKKQVWLYSLTSFGMLSVFSLGAIIAVIIDLSQYFITGSEFARMWSPFMHHRAILAPFLAYGAMDTALFLSRRISSKFIAAWLIITAITYQYVFHNPLNKLVKKEYWQNYSWMDNDRTLIEKVPLIAKVAAQQNLVPHLSHRREIYLIWPRKRQTDGNYCGEKLCWWLDFGGEPDYLVVDTRSGQWLTQILESNENWLSAILNMEKAGKIRLVDSAGDARLYEINYRLIQ